jgi:tetratricopeptide (TPR) repeat protein
MLFSLAISILLYQPTSENLDLIAQRNFLERAEAYRDAIIKNPSSRSIREYTVFITEYYAKQVTYRTFLMRNLSSGEHLTKLRRSQDDMVNNDNQKIIEPNLAGLLSQAQRDFPNNFDIKFATAHYFFSGRCCMPEAQQVYTTADLLKIFEEGLTKNIKSPTSLYALAIHEINQKDGDRLKALNYLKEAHQLNPFNSEYIVALINEELYQKNYPRSLQLSRVLFEMASTTEDRVTSMLYSARTLIGLEDYPKAMNFVQQGLKIEPRNAFFWMLGLDILRNGDNRDRYYSHIGFLLNQDPFNPLFFKTYTDYLATRGVHAWDVQYAEQYALEKPNNDQLIFFQNFNLATLFNLLDLPEKANKHLKLAKEKTGALDEQNVRFARLIEPLQERIDHKANQQKN